MKSLNALALACAMMFSGNVFAADSSSGPGGASVGNVPKAQPAYVHVRKSRMVQLNGAHVVLQEQISG